MIVMDHHIYINGRRHRCTAPGHHFFVDAPSHPGVPCSQHSLGPGSMDHMKAGGRVRTSGNWYSLNPDREQANG